MNKQFYITYVVNDEPQTYWLVEEGTGYTQQEKGTKYVADKVAIDKLLHLVLEIDKQYQNNEFKFTYTVNKENE